MATVFDAAKYICSRIEGDLTAMKLQKLVYYSQAWHAVWEDKALFQNRIEAWANGPVCPDLYMVHRGEFFIRPAALPGDPNALTPGEKSSIDEVIKFYGEFTSSQLSEQTHREAPWRLARDRACVDSGARCNEEIRLADMVEYYSSL